MVVRTTVLRGPSAGAGPWRGGARSRGLFTPPSGLGGKPASTYPGGTLSALGEPQGDLEASGQAPPPPSPGLGWFPQGRRLGHLHRPLGSPGARSPHFRATVAAAPVSWWPDLWAAGVPLERPRPLRTPLPTCWQRPCCAFLQQRLPGWPGPQHWLHRWLRVCSPNSPEGLHVS